MALSTPDMVVVGHVCRDLVPVPPGWRVGGSVYYAAATASKLGASVGIVTCGGHEVEALRELPGITVVALEVKTSTTFENLYELDRRQQYIRAVAPHIPDELVPSEWRRASLALLAPVAGEVPVLMARAFPSALVGVAAQGYMRRWDADGAVHPTTWGRAMAVLPHVAAVFFSAEDVRGQPRSWLRYCGPVMVETRGASGCQLIHCGKRRVVTGLAVEEVDPTGAGDVFAAAFMLELRETRDPVAAARFANCVASFSVTAVGAGGLPTREQIGARLSTWKSS